MSIIQGRGYGVGSCLLKSFPFSDHTWQYLHEGKILNYYLRKHIAWEVLEDTFGGVLATHAKI